MRENKQKRLLNTKIQVKYEGKVKMAENDATQSDATEEEVGQGYKDESEEAQEEFVEKESSEEEYLSPREQAMEELIAKRNEEFEQEANVVLPSEEPEETEELEEVVTVDSESPFFKDEGVWYTNVKVDGEDIRVPFDDLKSSHQKDKASQKRFEEAAEYARRIQHREAQLNAYVQQMQRQQAEQQPPPSQDAEPAQEQPDDSPDLIKKYHEALYEDDADKAAELFKALTNRGRSQPATQNVEEVVHEVLGRTIAQQRAQSERQQQWAYQKSMEDAVKWFDGEYPDIAGVAELRSIADNRTIDLTREHPDWSPQQIIQEAAETTRQWAKEYLSPEKNERATRKRKIVQQPKSASASSRIGEDEPAPQSTQDIINEMKQARGQVLQQ